MESIHIYLIKEYVRIESKCHTIRMIKKFQTLRKSHLKYAIEIAIGD